MTQNDGTLLQENAEIVFRNFAGREGMYNAEGDRNFCLILDAKTAEEMVADGWNVKFLKPREEGEDPTPYIQVSLKYRGRNGAKVKPPRTVLITSRGRTDLTEDEVELLDLIDIANVDLIVRPYQWAVNGKTGTKAYLKSLFITMQEDALEMKYADVPEVGSANLAIEAADDAIDVEFWEEDETKAIEA